MYRLMITLRLMVLILFFCNQDLKSQILKSIVYDFDGFDLNATTLPEGEYSYGDLSYRVTLNPRSYSEILNQEVLNLEINWNNGYAAFGRGISRFIEFDKNLDQFHFYFYNPLNNYQDAQIIVRLGEDDNQSNTYESASDDLWQYTLTVPGSSAWQKFDIPLNSFVDSNTGGNGIMDMGFTQGNGMLLLVEFRFNRQTGSPALANFFIDHICFSESGMPTGNNIHQLPAHADEDYCPLGAFEPVGNGDHTQIPINIEGKFTTVAGHKLKYVNTYLQWSQNGTTPNAFPGTSIQNLLTMGYRPIITWEPMFLTLAPLANGQPKLDDICNGVYDTYISAFADVMKNYTDTVIIRFMHEFDGDWYPWCISQNNQDVNLFINAFKRAVNIFRSRGATKVKWMWCPNSDYAPYQQYNWSVLAYPGDNFVDYVATDLYNGHYPLNQPWWRSFRWVATESYYYLHKYFPTKPLIICELGCRARISTDNQGAQSKADWYAEMDKQMRSNFSKSRGLIFFNSNTGAAQDWTIDSDAAALQSLDINIWQNEYYFFAPDIPQGIITEKILSKTIVYPNPCNGQFSLINTDVQLRYYQLTDLNGKIVKKGSFTNAEALQISRAGTFLLEIFSPDGNRTSVQKIVSLP